MGKLDKYITAPQAREVLGLSRDQMIRRLRSGHIKSERPGWSWLIPISELERVPTTDWYKATKRSEPA